MTEKSYDISGKIDPATLAVFDSLQLLTEGMRFFVVGAAARDISLYYLYDIKIVRATQDIDLGIQVSSWNEYDQLRTGLLSSDEFTETSIFHRFRHKNGYPVDLLPFGGIESSNSTFKWPPDPSSQMNVLGFDDAFRSSWLICLRKAPLLQIRVANPTGVVMLKVISWADQPEERSNDAKDIFEILSNYLDLGNYDRLLKEETDLLDVDDFDAVAAGARMLGRDLAQTSGQRILDRLLEILHKELSKKDRSRLAQQMWSGAGNSLEEKGLDPVLRLLKEMTIGLQDTL